MISHTFQVIIIFSDVITKTTISGGSSGPVTEAKNGHNNVDFEDLTTKVKISTLIIRLLISIQGIHDLFWSLALLLGFDQDLI